MLSRIHRATSSSSARGRSPSEIAWDLEMAPSTVSTHLKAIREKLGVRSAFEVAQYAARHGISGAA
jgi:DNA-binding CsgD family transcriptional regulator